MPLRNLNESPTVYQILTNIASVAVGNNTEIAAASGSVMVDTRVPLYSGQATFPATVFWEGPQSSARIYWRLWQARISITCVYIDRWDQQQQYLDVIWKNIDTDLRRMKANIEDNPRIFVSGVRSVLDITTVSLSPFAGNVNDKEYLFPVVEREMIIQANLIPYGSAA